MLLWNSTSVWDTVNQISGFFLGRRVMDGVSFRQFDQYALCCVEKFSEDLKSALRENLTRICHGVDQASRDRAIFKYPATLKVFWDRYSAKSTTTRIGMLGELLAHVIILKLFPNFDVISPFFDMEEKSIRKGFDLLLYELENDNIWITEVKAGGLGKGSTPCETTRLLLGRARDDLKNRLAEQEPNYWLNAINAAYKSIQATASYRESVLELLGAEGDLAVGNGAVASDNNVFLISALFGEISTQVVDLTVSEFATELNAQSYFKSVWILSLHKGTLQKLENFLKEEAGL